MNLTRRDFIKANAIAATAVAAGVAIPTAASNLMTKSADTTISGTKPLVVFVVQVVVF